VLESTASYLTKAHSSTLFVPRGERSGTEVSKLGAGVLHAKEEKAYLAYATKPQYSR
jgi:hypothetical protein